MEALEQPSNANWIHLHFLFNANHFGAGSGSLIRRGRGNLIWLTCILFPLASYILLAHGSSGVRSEAPVLWSGKRIDAMVSSKNDWLGGGSKFHQPVQIISYDICNLNLRKQQCRQDIYSFVCAKRKDLLEQ